MVQRHGLASPRPVIDACSGVALALTLTLALTSLGTTALGTTAAARTVHLAADFDDKPIDEPIGTGGPALGEPVSVDPTILATVRDAPFATPCLEIQDNDDYAAGCARFELLEGAEITDGIATVHVSLWFPAPEPGCSFYIYVREQGSSARRFCNLTFTEDAWLACDDEDSNNGYVAAYPTGAPFPLVLTFDMDAGTYDVWVDGARVLDDEPHGVSDRGVGAILFGCLHDGDLAGCFFLDDLLVDDEEITTAVEPPGPAAVAAVLHPCAPNPFNPVTEIRFTLDRPALVDLWILDLAGRRLAHPRTGRHGSGEHRVHWDGRDGSGRPLASGIYVVRLETGGRSAARTVVLAR